MLMLFLQCLSQELWMDLVSEAASDPCTPPKLKEQLARMAELGNVPRQEKKFKNFVKNSLRLWNDAEIEAIWKHLEGLRAAQRDASAEAAAEAATAAAAAAVVEVPDAVAVVVAVTEDPAVQADAQSSSKKRKRDKTAAAADSDSHTAAAEITNGDNMEGVAAAAAAAPDFAKAAKKALKSAGESGLSVKELRKAVLAAVIAGGCSDSEKALKKQFTAALDAGLKHVAVEGKTAKLQKKQ
jgi:hypothetical protein